MEKEFEKVVKTYSNTIYTVCYMFSNDNDEINDLFQETLINLWKGFSNFQGKSNVSTWIWRVAFNTCISQQRKKKSHPTQQLPIDINLFEDRDEDTKQIQMLYRRIHALQPFDRAIVLLWLEGVNYEEIGEIVGITAKNVSVRLYRIKEELKKMSNSKD